MFSACTFFCRNGHPMSALSLPLGANRRHRAAQRGHPPRQRPAYARTKATDYQLPPGMSVTAAIARAWDVDARSPPRVAQRTEPACRCRTHQSKVPAKSGFCQSFTNWAVGISKRSPWVDFPWARRGDRSAPRHLPRGLLAGQPRPDPLGCPCTWLRDRPLDPDPSSAARAPQSMLRSVSSLTPVGPPALAMISRMSMPAPPTALRPPLPSVHPSWVPLTQQSKGTAPQCDSASIRHRDETSGRREPLARCGESLRSSNCPQTGWCRW